MGRTLLLVFILSSCAAREQTHESGQHAPASARPDPSNSSVLRGGTVFGVGKTNLRIVAGRVSAVGVTPEPGENIIDASGRFVVPGFIDSHVHLAYDPAGDELLANGIVAVLDLAAPLGALTAPHGSLIVQNAGPMLTAPLGYPTTSWGHDGYGLEVASPAEGASAVETLVKAGVQVIKVPLTTPPTLDDDTVKAIVQTAHRHQLKVYAHALEAANAARAAADGVDVLAHTPVEPLDEATLDAWQSRTVISTLAAFNGAATVANLRALHQRGARVLYGTDFGNTRDTHIQTAEIDALLAAGFSGEEIVKVGTVVPAEFLGLSDLGTLEPGKRASFLLLDRDPSSDPHALSAPSGVYVDGARVGGR